MPRKKLIVSALGQPILCMSPCCASHSIHELHRADRILERGGEVYSMQKFHLVSIYGCACGSSHVLECVSGVTCPLIIHAVGVVTRNELFASIAAILLKGPTDIASHELNKLNFRKR